MTSVAVAPSAEMATAVTLHVECSGPVVAIQTVYTATGIDSGTTPRTPVTGCPASVNLLGLLSGVDYHTTIKLWSAEDSVTAAGPNANADTLPGDLPQVSIMSRGTYPHGMTAFAVLNPSRTDQGLALIVDSIGRIRWYFRSSRIITDLQPQPQPIGRYTLALANYDPLAFTTLGYLGSEYQELDIGGDFLRKWTVTGGYFTDNHDIRLSSRGTGALLGFDFRIMDLSSLGLSQSTQVIGNLLQEVDSTGAVLFSWNVFDHFSFADIDSAVVPLVTLSPTRIDWTHANALDVDRDGNYLVSFRHLSEVTKIDSRSGAVLWRMGGVRNVFHFDSDTNRFSFQHGVRRLASGNLLMFDNGNTRTPPFSRAIEYRLDEQAHSAAAVWQYRPTPDLFTFALGFAERLSDGNTLVTFGTRGVVQEVTPAGGLVWQLTVPNGLWIYRAYRIRSLYDLGGT